MFCLQVYHGAWPVPYCWGGWLHIGRRLTIDATNHWQLSGMKIANVLKNTSCNWPFLCRNQCSGHNRKIWVGRWKCPSNAGDSLTAHMVKFQIKKLWKIASILCGFRLYPVWIFDPWQKDFEDCIQTLTNFFLSAFIYRRRKKLPCLLEILLKVVLAEKGFLYL